ncbi:signal peptidase I [Mobilitalea sibirica]|uniref:Signal peptidase I n=1 Tax=Mobilitalea sibirica TaxID=1462919 RepID=A0A8J7HDE5_9FIRM|nr:signal peptidase I [Mobilitalea sibirica]MBH1940669.1 signal peptidase I [Mobilitalea sibirica]
MNNKVIKEIISWLIVMVVALGLAILLNKFVLYKVSPPTGSMENTIMIGDKVYTYRLAYLFHKPERGDIVVFSHEAEDDEEIEYIKRIIGLPGEKIEGKDGLVYIDDEPLEENYVTAMLDSDFGPYTIPEDSYFMMGDNRGISLDARDWTNKYVNRENIHGKAILKYPDFKFLY